VTITEPHLPACLPVVCAASVSDACVEAGSLAAYSVQLSTGLCPARGSQTVVFRGVPCGPSNSLVQWEALSAPACGANLARASLDPKQQADWVGQCGVPPMQISGLPTKICGSASTMSGDQRPRRVRSVVAPPHMPSGDSADVAAVTPMSLGRANLAKGESSTTWGMARIGAREGEQAGGVQAGVHVVGDDAVLWSSARALPSMLCV
jgi:hypothetical protein